MSYWKARISSGSLVSSASNPPCGIENGLWLNSICPVSSFFSYIGDDERVSEIGLVGTVFERRVGKGDAREGRRRHAAPAAELLEDAVEDRLDRGEDILLCHKRHLEIELIELARRAVGPGRLVA